MSPTLPFNLNNTNINTNTMAGRATGMALIARKRNRACLFQDGGYFICQLECIEQTQGTHDLGPLGRQRGVVSDDPGVEDECKNWYY